MPFNTIIGHETNSRPEVFQITFILLYIHLLICDMVSQYGVKSTNKSAQNSARNDILYIIPIRVSFIDYAFSLTYRFLIYA